MTLKKTIASYKKDDGTLEPQITIDMGSFEEAMTLSSWSMGDHGKNKPKKLSMEERVNALSNPSQGTIWIAAQDENYIANYNTWKSKHDSLETDYISKNDAFNNKMSTLPPGTQTC